MASNSKFHDIMIVALCLIGVFGGLAFIIAADYAKIPAWTTADYWIGGCMMGTFVLYFAIWFFSSGRK